MNQLVIDKLNLVPTGDETIWLRESDKAIFRQIADDIQIRLPSGFQTCFNVKMILNNSKERLNFILERMANPSIMKTHKTPDQIKNNKLPD